jgi:hypothetical protein
MTTIRSEVTGRRLGAKGTAIEQPRARGPPLPASLELERYVSPAEAARILGVSQETIRRHYRALFRQLSPRRLGIKLKDLLAAAEAA